MSSAFIFEDNGCLKVTGEISFAVVKELFAKSTPWFQRQKSLTFDFSGVSRSDSAGVALLVYWKRLAKASQTTISFDNMPEQMQRIIQVCGVSRLLSNES